MEDPFFDTLVSSGQPATPPDFIAALGLALPVSVDDVEEAYRTKAKLLHPDAGGSEEEFKALQQAYERAIEYARFRAGRAVWLGASVERYAEQQAFVNWLRQLGATVREESIDWLTQSIGSDFAQILERVVSISFAGKPIGDDLLQQLAQHESMLSALHSLDLSGTQITDAGLLELRVFPSLRVLNLSNTTVTAAGLQVLDRLPRLDQLDLTGTPNSWFGLYKLRHAHPGIEIKS